MKFRFLARELQNDGPWTQSCVCVCVGGAERVGDWQSKEVQS